MNLYDFIKTFNCSVSIQYFQRCKCSICGQDYLAWDEYHSVRLTSENLDEKYRYFHNDFYIDNDFIFFNDDYNVQLSDFCDKRNCENCKFKNYRYENYRETYENYVRGDSEYRCSLEDSNDLVFLYISDCVKDHDCFQHYAEVREVQEEIEEYLRRTEHWDERD